MVLVLRHRAKDELISIWRPFRIENAKEIFVLLFNNVWIFAV